MTKPVALLDIDNTIYRGFSLFSLLHHQVEASLVDQDVLLEAKAVLQAFRAGQLAYEDALRQVLDIHSRGLQGRSYDVVQASTQQFFRESTDFYDFVDQLVGILKRTHQIILVTGEPQMVGQAVADIIGADDFRATIYEVDNGLFTGRVESYLATRHEKLSVVRQAIDSRPKGSFAFGDSEGDVEMLEAVEHAVCINPTPGLQAIAQARHWHIATTDDITQIVRSLLP